MEKLKPCPFCGEIPKILISDDEGNIHDDDYKDDPWSGLSYQIGHFVPWSDKGYRCPIATKDEDESIGCCIYESEDALISEWNNRK